MPVSNSTSRIGAAPARTWCIAGANCTATSATKLKSELYRIKAGEFTQHMASTGAGLEGVVATSSQICFIDGHQGTLSYFGYNIHTLADSATFEETIYLLWNGRLPNRVELEQLRSSLIAERDLPQEVTAFLKNAPQGAQPMDVLRTAVSALSLYDPLARDNSTEANVKKAVKLMARVATIVTSFDRLRKGKEVVPGDPALGYAANFLYALTGKKPDDVMERVFD